MSIDIAYELLEKFNLTLLFREYLKNGYYPFYFEDKEDYLLCLNETINIVIEVDIPSIFPIEYASIQNLKKLVRLLCLSHPYTPNIKELLVKMDMGAYCDKSNEVLIASMLRDEHLVSIPKKG